MVVVSAVSDVIMLGANYSNSLDYVDRFNSKFLCRCFVRGLSYHYLLSLDVFERLWRFSAGYPHYYNIYLLKIYQECFVAIYSTTK